jgi:predicted dehydrogenase
LVAGCDVVERSRREWGAAHGVAETGLYADAGTMLDHAGLDVAIVATHAPLHCAATLAAAARGIHVFCEKPLAPCLRDADEMVAACAAGGVKLAVNHIKRGSRGNEAARKLIADGAIGRPYLMRGEGKGGRWAGSELMEMGTHVFDWLRILAGDPEWIFARLTQHDRPAEIGDIVHSLDLPYRERDCGLVLGERAYCALGLPGGMHADIGFLSQPSGDDAGYGFDICGTEGTLALRRSVGTDLYLQRGRHRGPLAAQPWEKIEVDEFAELDPPVKPGGIEGERLALQRRVLGDFLDAIVEDREPWSSGRDGLRALELSMAVWESHLTGQPLTLPLGDRTHPLERRRGNTAG